MNLLTCNSCQQHYYKTEDYCPHCGPQARKGLKPAAAAVAVLLGLNSVACNGLVGEPEYGVAVVDTGDTAEEPVEPASEPTSEPTSEPANEADYGVPMVSIHDLPASTE